MEKKYKITIVSYGENPNYEAEKAEYLEKQSNKIYYRNKRETFLEDHLSRVKTERVLEVFLTEAEYLAIKKGVIETFK